MKEFIKIKHTTTEKLKQRHQISGSKVSHCKMERAPEIIRRAIDCLGLPPDLMNKKAGLVVLCTGGGSTSMMHDPRGGVAVERRRRKSKRE